VSLPPAFYARPFAHRGLWSLEGPPENSVGAIAAACAAGYGVELDVRITADGEAVVFHDPTFERMCGVKGWVEETLFEEARQLRLKGTEERIPTLSEVLAAAAGRSMLLIELKVAAGREGDLEERVANLLDGYGGAFAVIGFNAQSLAWFAKHRPRFLRGLDAERLSDEALAETTLDLAYLFEGQVMMAKPHFLALDVASTAGKVGRRYRKQGLPVVAWTVRGKDQVVAHSPDWDNFIFEGFEP
jgi:glycerophosphoryl diester phosphodiesterase